jgi:uncharacterized protein
MKGCEASMDMRKRLIPLEPTIMEIPDNNIGAGYIVGSKCKKCGEYYYPRRYVCLVCGNRDLEKTRLSGKGKIWSFTKIDQAMPKTLIREVPYVIAVVELQEKVLVKGILKNVLKTELKLGAEVEAVFEKVSEDKEGNDLIAFKFRLI